MIVTFFTVLSLNSTKASTSPTSPGNFAQFNSGKSMAASCKSAAISTIPDFEYVSYSRCSFIAELPEISTLVKSPIRLDKYSDGDVFTTSFTVLSSDL